MCFRSEETLLYSNVILFLSFHMHLLIRALVLFFFLAFAHILPCSLQWQSAACDYFGFEKIHHVRLVEGSAQTVIRPEVHVQPLVMYFVICPLYLAEVESSTYAVAHLKAPVRTSRFVLEAKTHSSTCLRKLSHHCCSSCFGVFEFFLCITTH